jgi:hypothetical protein
MGMVTATNDHLECYVIMQVCPFSVHAMSTISEILDEARTLPGMYASLVNHFYRLPKRGNGGNNSV